MASLLPKDWKQARWSPDNCRAFILSALICFCLYYESTRYWSEPPPSGVPTASTFATAKETRLAFNLTQCIPSQCHRLGSVEPTCVLTQELSCLDWMNATSDCNQDDRAPLPPSPVFDPVAGVVRYHTYWSGKLTRVVMLSIASLLVTQPAASTRLIFWTDSDRIESMLSNLNPEMAGLLNSARIEMRKFNLSEHWAAVHEDFANVSTTKTLEWIDAMAFSNSSSVGFSDAVRLFVLYRYGGVYIDMDVLFMRDMAPLLQLTPFAYSWSCVGHLVNTAVLALVARSDVAWQLMSASLQRVSSEPSRNAAAFHPWRLSDDIKDHKISINIVSSYLLDPLWIRTDRREPLSVRLAPSCNQLRNFADFFRKQAQELDPPRKLAAPDGAEAGGSLGEELTFCYPAFGHHWHNQYGSPISDKSAGGLVEAWLHKRLNLSSHAASVTTRPP